MSDDIDDAASRVTPGWPTCANDECIGRQIEGFEHCLAHLEASNLDDFLHGVTPGAPLDLRGTTLTNTLLDRLLQRVSEDPESPAQLGEADFRYCSFPTVPARFERVRFAGAARFGGARFAQAAEFGGARFDGPAEFRDAQFAGSAGFVGARFAGPAGFVGARFAGSAGFGGARFFKAAVFVGARFARDAGFVDARFDGSAEFGSARFTGSAEFGVAQFDGPAGFGGARFDGPAGFGSARFAQAAGFGVALFAGSAGFGGARFAGHAEFVGARFAGSAGFGVALFDGPAWFGGARFDGSAGFVGARFAGSAGFGDALFDGPAWFGGARFAGHAEFDGARFAGHAGFGDALFDGPAWFGGARFAGHAEFDGARFAGSAGFGDALFESLTRFGPLVTSDLRLDGASFKKRVVLEVEAGALSAVDTRFEGGVELRVRHARISLRRVFFGGPSSLSGAPAPFTTVGGEHVQADPDDITAWVAAGGGKSVRTLDRRSADLEAWIPQVLCLQETDVSQLTLADVDLRWCRFAGAHQLDKLRLEGRGPFNRPPGWRVGWAWPPVWRWSSRRVLAEEHPWRAGRRKSGGWTKDLPDLHGVADVPPVGPERLAVLYRSLRKAFEDGKNEPGAGDFYYGEMEARRRSAASPRRERALLAAYWMISGYGQRAGRALAALAVLIGVLFVLLTQFGLPDGTALQQMTGTVPATVAGQPQQISIEVTAAPATLPPPGQRWTADRMSRAIRIALGSVVFRDADQKLTAQGVWIVMAGRAFGPLLLALAALAIRARVKR